MLISRRIARARALGVFLPASFAVSATTWSSTARAHFVLETPQNWMTEDSAGFPQKLGPCGDEGGGTPTGTITPFQPGQTITLTWSEVVPHDGWYRIAISYQDRTDFTDPPVVITPDGLSADAGIESPALPPVLADGIFPHLASEIASGKEYSYELTLPTTPCDKCTLQIIQYMNNHPSNLANLPDGATNPDGFFYHHCADISISAAASGSPSGDGGAGLPAADASAPANGGAASPRPGGGGCVIAPGRESGGVASFLGMAYALARLRRKNGVSRSARARAR